MAQVIVKPLDSVFPAKEKEFRKTGKDSFTQKRGYQVLLGQDGKYATGLTKEQQEELENQLGFDLSNTYKQGEAHPFWSSREGTLFLENRTQVFDTDKPMDRLKVLNMKAHKCVANSVKEYELGLFPHATHVIFDEGVATTLKATQVQKKSQAYSLLSSMDKSKKINLIWLVLNVSAVKQSDDFITSKLGEAIEKEIDKFLATAEMSNEALHNKALILEAEYRGILTKKNGGYFYMDGMLGYDLDDAATKLQHPDNQQLKAVILQRLQST